MPPGLPLTDARAVSLGFRMGRMALAAGRLARAGRRLLFPEACVFCGTECLAGEPAVCAGCSGDLPWLGPHCGRCAGPLENPADDGRSCGACLTSPPPFERATAVFRYVFPVDAAIRAFKFRKRLDYARAFGPLLACRARNLADSLADGLAADVDAVLPVPLYWRRQWRRGYNQAAELARPVAAALDLDCLRGVRRRQPTAYQAGLTAAGRRRNLVGAFAADGRVDAAHVLIVDDVVTTGATCRQLARTVLAAGAGRVSVLALARAAQDVPTAGLNE